MVDLIVVDSLMVVFGSIIISFALRLIVPLENTTGPVCFDDVTLEPILIRSASYVLEPLTVSFWITSVY